MASHPPPASSSLPAVNGGASTPSIVTYPGLKSEASAPPSSPFGWTGIRRQRYTRWSGHLDGRRKITMRMMKEGVRFNIRTWPVILLLVLSWMFTAFFPILFAAMGGLALEMDAPDTWDPSLGATVAMHHVIRNESAAVYSLTGGSFTRDTVFSTIDVPNDVDVFVNSTPSGDGLSAWLTVVPPPSIVNGSTDIRLVAKTGETEDSFYVRTNITSDPFQASRWYSYDLAFASPLFGGRAGSDAKVRFSLSNSGTMPDSYDITVAGIPAGWKMSAYVDGTPVAVRTVKVSDRTAGGPFGVGGSFTARFIQLDLQPGESASCEVRLATESDSPRLNDVILGIRSGHDPFVSGNYHALVKLSDTRKVDLTGEILYDQVMSLQVFFALLLAAVVGSRMISTDLSEKSYNLYFARPLTKTDYLAGKFGTAGAILALSTLVPTLVTYSFLLLLSNLSSSYVAEHLWVWGAIIGQGLVIVLTFSTLSLAFSSMTARRFYAAAAMVVIYLVTAIMGGIVTGAFNSKYGRLIGISDNLDVTGRTAFGIAENLELGFPWWYSLAALAAIWAVCAFLVWYKIERTELSE
jgi:ABC-type transport system involved in multi-copper enzyme maturation permease subunit